MLNKPISRFEYNKLVMQVTTLSKAIVDLVRDELKASVVRKLEKKSQALDDGKGRSFANLKLFRSYLEDL